MILFATKSENQAKSLRLALDIVQLKVQWVEFSDI